MDSRSSSSSRSRVALVFDVINGFHDAANSIATVVSTRVLSPRIAVLWAAIFNFVALFIFTPKVADTIAKIVHIKAGDPAFVWVVIAGLVGAIVWNLLTWWWGLFQSQVTDHRTRSQIETKSVFWTAPLDDAIDRETVEVHRSKEMLSRKERTANTKAELALVSEEKQRLKRHQDELKRRLKQAILRRDPYTSAATTAVPTRTPPTLVRLPAS